MCYIFFNCLTFFHVQLSGSGSNSEWLMKISATCSVLLKKIKTRMSHLLKAEKVRKKTSVSESSPLKRRQTALWTSSSSEVAPLLTPSDAPSDGSLDKLQLWRSASPDTVWCAVRRLSGQAPALKQRLSWHRQAAAVRLIDLAGQF